MTEPKLIMEVFKNKPNQWGLRGDPELWEKLRLKFQNTEVPTNSREFNTLLEEQFDSLINSGEKKSDGIIWFEEFSQNGMSGGSVSIVWWKETGLPLLKERFETSIR